MKRTAGFLKFLATIAVIFEGIALCALVLATGLLITTGDLGKLPGNSTVSMVIQGTNLTPEQVGQYKPYVLIALALAIACIVFILLGTIKMRKALEECRNERPFSEVSVNALKSSARMEIIGGILGIASGLFLSFMASFLKINGTSAGTSVSSFNLSFLVYACGKYLLYHIAEYGHQLENR